KTGWQAMRLAVVAYVVPFMFIYFPALLLLGSPVDITLAVITALIGVMALAGGVEGCLLRRINWWHRSLLIAGGLLLIIPKLTTSLAGATLVAIVIIQIRLSRQVEPTLESLRPGELDSENSRRA
ncbi:MAG: C4-dicarboxylate ABC transporter permease, partial [Chloroflexi bacterium]|nr:C4-dicarboxylate ABC transporter permease [Chloroflexota bacterium]